VRYAEMTSVQSGDCFSTKPAVVYAHRSQVSELSAPVLVLRWLGGRVVSALDSGAEGPGFKSQSRRCRVTVLGKLVTPIVPLFTKQRNW